MRVFPACHRRPPGIGSCRDGGIPDANRDEADALVLVVDDQSPDGTADLAEKVGVELGGVEVLRRPGKEGLGAAYKLGKQMREMKAMKDPAEYRRGIEAEVRKQMEAEFASREQAKAAAAAAIPPDRSRNCRP